MREWPFLLAAPLVSFAAGWFTANPPSPPPPPDVVDLSHEPECDTKAVDMWSERPPSFAAAPAPAARGLEREEYWVGSSGRWYSERVSQLTRSDLDVLELRHIQAEWCAVASIKDPIPRGREALARVSPPYTRARATAWLKSQAVRLRASEGRSAVVRGPRTLHLRAVTRTLLVPGGPPNRQGIVYLKLVSAEGPDSTNAGWALRSDVSIECHGSTQQVLREVAFRAPEGVGEEEVIDAFEFSF